MTHSLDVYGGTTQLKGKAPVFNPEIHSQQTLTDWIT